MWDKGGDLDMWGVSMREKERVPNHGNDRNHRDCRARRT